MPTIRALVRSSAFLRRSHTQPEEKFVHSGAVIGAALWRPWYAYDYGEFPYSASAKSPNPGQGCPEAVAVTAATPSASFPNGRDGC